MLTPEQDRAADAQMSIIAVLFCILLLICGITSCYRKIFGEPHVVETVTVATNAIPAESAK